MTVGDLIENFNDGNWDYISKIFRNNVLTFLKFIHRKNLLSKIDLTQIPNDFFSDEVFDFLVDNTDISEISYYEIPEEIKNHYLLYHLEHNYEWAMEFITKNLLSDVSIRQDGFYLHLRDRDDLKILFCEGRRGEGARYVAKLILSEDGLGHDWYYDNSVTPHQVVDELDDANTTTLIDTIFKEIGDKELSLEDYDSDFFSELSEDQGTDGYFRLRAQDLEGLVKDESAFNELCKNDLDDLGSSLRSLYWQAENSAYEDEVYELVYGGLEEYFEGRISEVPREVTKTDGSKVTRYDSYIKIRNFHNIIDMFLEANKGGYWNDSHLEYFGGLVTLMVGMMNNDEMDCIDFRVPEYPDWDRTRKNINELFNDYL